MPLRFTWDRPRPLPTSASTASRSTSAARVFADPAALTEHDRVEGGEYRWRTIGSVESLLVLVVAHTLIDDDEPTERIRIISARRAGPFRKASL
ncbi:MAG: BrnT family toxin [Rhodospirillales bacterium]